MGKLFKKRYNKRAFMLSDGNDCSFGNDIPIVHSRWQAFIFARQSGCSLVYPFYVLLWKGNPVEGGITAPPSKGKQVQLLEASFLDWFIPGKLGRS